MQIPYGLFTLTSDWSDRALNYAGMKDTASLESRQV